MMYSTTFSKPVFVISVWLFGPLGFGQVPALPEEKSLNEKAVMKSTIRLHTKGMFSYGGRVACNNPAADINFVYEYKTFGFQIFKSFDLRESNSSSNFMLAALYKNIKITNRLKFTPHVAVALEQEHSFAGHGSDLGFIATTTLKLDNHFSIDHTMLVGNLVVSPDSKDWVNRIRLLFTSKHLDITTSLWHNNHVFDADDYSSGALSVAYNRIRISEHLNMNFAVTDMGVIQTSDREFFPKGNNLILSTSMQFVR